MTPRSYKAASSVRSPSSLIIKAILLISLLTLPASINAQDDEQPPSEGETTTALEDPTSTTTTSPSPTAPPQPTVRASDCIKLTTSSACPSFQSGWIYTKGRVGTVERFDRLVLDTVYANASAPSLGAVNVVVASGCAGWDEGRVRYARGFFCSLYLTLPDVIGGVAGSINDCNIIATSTTPSSSSTPMSPSISRPNCNAFTSSIETVLRDPISCPVTNISADARSARDTLRTTATGFCAGAPNAPGAVIGTTTTAAAAVPTDVAALVPGTKVVDMSKDKLESLDCGFGASSTGNRTKSFLNAYDYCLTANATDTCCQYDTNLRSALLARNPTAFIPKPPTDSDALSTCDVKLGTYVLPCGTLLGFIIGVVMSIGSCILAFLIIRRQPKKDDGKRPNWRPESIIQPNLDSRAPVVPDEPVPHYPRPSMDGPYGMGGEAPREPVPQRPPTYGRPAPEQPYGMGDYDAQRPAQASNGYVHTPTSPSQRYPPQPPQQQYPPQQASYQQQQSGAQVERSRSRSGSQGRSQRQAAPPQQGYDGYQQQQGQGHSRSGSGSSRPPTIPRKEYGQ